MRKKTVAILKKLKVNLAGHIARGEKTDGKEEILSRFHQMGRGSQEDSKTRVGK